MDDRLSEMLDNIRRLELDLIGEIEKKEQEFFYKIQKKKVLFDGEVRKKHRALKRKIPRYLVEARFF